MEVVEKEDANPSAEETFHTPPASPVASENELQKTDTSCMINHLDDKCPFNVSEEKEQCETADGDVDGPRDDIDAPRDDQPPFKKCRFSPNGTEENNIIQDVPENTRNQNIWCFNIWKAWADWRNGVTDASLKDSSYQTVPLDPRDATENEFGFWLARFVVEVRNSKGDPYPPNSLLNLLYGLQRYCNNRTDGLGAKLKIFDVTNSNFNDFYRACEKVMKDLTLQGVGQDVKKADIITDDDEDKLWSSGAINLNTAWGLLYGVYFYNVRAFGLQGGKIHRDLDRNQFSIEYDVQLGVEKLIYSERIKAPRQTCLSRLKVPRPKTASKPEILAQADNPRCIVHLFKTYLSLIPDKGPFYFQPSRSKNDDAYSVKPVGVNTLARFLPEMYQAAKIDLSGRYISGRSGRVTINHKLVSEGYMKSSFKEPCPPQLNYIKSYMPRDETTRVGVSDVLQAKRPVDDKKNDVDDEMPPLRPIQVNNSIQPVEIINSSTAIHVNNISRPIEMIVIKEEES